MECILDDMDPPFDGLKGYKALAAVVACMESVATGKVCKVQNVPPKVKVDCKPAKKAASKKK